ncbi:MAG: HK97-gp10 family putative phage morphogenesis protein [Gallionella sp.]|jgi:HK97 gp10 family phage protein
MAGNGVREIFVMSDAVHVKGLSELQKFLDTFTPKLQKNIMRGALRSGARPIMKQAKINAPVGEPSSTNKTSYGGYAGALRDTIRVASRRDNGMQVMASVVAGGRVKKTGAKVFYAHLVEYTGAAPHTITAKGLKSISFGGAFFQSVQHPGMKAQPFMRPALDAQAQIAVVAVGNYIKNRLTKQGLDTSGINIEGTDE